MSLNKKQYIEYIEKNGKMEHPILFNLLHEGQITNMYSFKHGDEHLLDFKKLDNVTDTDVYDLVPTEELRNLVIAIMYEKKEKEKFKKSDLFVPVDILNRELLKMVNEKYVLKDIQYSIVIDEAYKNKKFTYFEIIILRAVYNLYRKNIRTFTTNDVYYQCFQCYGKNISIKNTVKKTINSSLIYLNMIEIDINAYDSFISKGKLLSFEKIQSNNENNTYVLLNEPILYNFACNNKHYMIDINNNYLFTLGKRNLKNLTIYTKLLDFIIAVGRSRNKVLEIKFSTIFDECDLIFNNGTNRKKKIKLIKDYLEYFIQNKLIIHYVIEFDSENKYDKITVYDYNFRSKKKKNTFLKAVKESEPTLKKVYEEKQVLESSYDFFIKNNNINEISF